MKKFLFFFIVLFWAFNSFAQNTLNVIDTGNITRERWRDSVLRMDMSQVSTGFLLEYSMFGFDSNKYDGVGNDDDTIKNDGRIFELHNILWYSKVNNNAVIDPTDSLFSKAFFENRNDSTIPLTFIYQKYNRIRQTALSEGLFTIAADSVGILDASNRSVSPYDSLEIFAFAPFKTSITQFNAIQFTLPNDLFYMPGITAVDIDFDDGAGFRSLSKGGSIGIYYATEGTKYVTAKITTSGGVRIAKSMIQYARPQAFTTPDYSLNISVAPVYTNDDDYLNAGLSKANPYSPMGDPVVPCGKSFIEQLLCGVNPSANIEVINGCDNVFDKPIIVVEGFDPDGGLTLEKLIARFNQSKFIETMRGYGYDFVFVDLTANTTYIENNAKVLEAVINWVNQHKTGTYKSTVIGFSMGGLVARWCLKDMEDRSITHNVENFFSYDAPQQGANIPLGMQYIFREMVRDMPYLKFNSSLSKLDDAFKSRAARQMLVTYGDYDNSAFNWFPSLNTLNPLRAAFAERLKDKGYPQQTNNFGIALGRGNNTASTKDAGNGRQFTSANPFNPESQIFGGSIGYLLVNLEADGYAVPENNNEATIAYYSFFGLTFRKIFGIPIIPTLKLRVRRFDYTGQYPYDDGQGSFEQTQTEFARKFRGWAVGLGMPGTTDGHDGHNFVATASALDLQNQTYDATNKWQSSNIFYNIDNQIQNAGQVNGNTLITSSLSPFDAVMTSTSECATVGCSAEGYFDENGDYVYPTNSNQWDNFHNTDITFQTAQFIERNILNAQPVDCAGYNGLCSSDPTISGAEIICTNGQYQLSSPPNGVTINWEMQNGKLKIDNGQGTPVINVSKKNTGTEVVKVTVTNACGASLVLTKNIYVGAPIKPGSITFDLIDPVMGKIQARIDPVPGATSYNWYKNGVLITGSLVHDYFIQFTIPKRICDVEYDIGVEAVNSCGISLRTSANAYVPCDSYFMISPNPATSSITISDTNDKSYNASSSKTITEVNIYDNLGNLKKHQNFSKSKTATLQVSGLISGVYVVEISDGIYKERHQVVIAK